MERVLVIDRDRLFEGTWPHGFVPIAPAERREWVARLAEHAYFLDRDVAEQDPSRKQLVPYCVVRRGPEVLCVERLPAQGEVRLHGRLSIGLGGHVNPEDGRIESGIFAAAMARELAEELVLPATAPAPTFVGLLNDDTDAVGAVHAGLVHELALPADSAASGVEIREITKLRGAFRVLVGPSSLWQDSDRLESWSSLLLDRFSARTDTSEHPASERSHARYARKDERHGGTQRGEAVP